MSSPVFAVKEHHHHKHKKSEENSLLDSVETESDIAGSWNDSQEKLLKGISERANCMRWLHTQCNLYFESLNFWLTIPNVVISTLNGSFTMSLPSMFPDPDGAKGATTVIGLVSIFSAVLITMNQYVKSQQMMEAHRAAALSQGKLHRMIMNELSIPRDQRANGLEFLKQVRQEIDRLENTSPNILPKVIKQFNIQFADRNIEKPEIAGDLDEVEINKEIEDHKHKYDKDDKSPVNKTVRIVKDLSGGIMRKVDSFQHALTGTHLFQAKKKDDKDDMEQEAENIVVRMTQPPPKNE